MYKKKRETKKRNKKSQKKRETKRNKKSRKFLKKKRGGYSIDNDPSGLIELYLSSIGNGVGLNGAEVDCSVVSGPSLLSKQIVANEKVLRASNDPAPPMTRSKPGYIGHGAFGMVFSRMAGRRGIPENTFAIKIIQDQNVKSSLENEVNYQKIAAAHGIAPKVYDYFIYNCEDGVSRGIIIMEFLSGYKNGYEIYQELSEKRDQANEVSPGFGNAIYNPKLLKLNNNIRNVENVLKSLNIYLPDFQTNVMANNNQEVKALDFGMAIPNPTWLE